MKGGEEIEQGVKRSEMNKSWRVRSACGILLTLGFVVVMVMELQKYTEDSLVVPRSKTCEGSAEELEVALMSIMSKSTTPENPKLVRAIRDYFIDPPSTGLRKMSLPLFKTPQADAIDKILGQKEQGFFVECGALDGERSSNSIFFEIKRKWTGLLIEMDPSWYMQLRGKNRGSYSINACISPYQYPIKMNFKEHNMGQGKLRKGQRTSDKVHSVYCFPFFSVMLAMNRTRIDYFSLDVEGFELHILKTIPFNKLDITTFSVEYAHAQDKQTYVDFMEANGYQLHSTIEKFKKEIYFGCKDFIFVKKGVL